MKIFTILIKKRALESVGRKINLFSMDFQIVEFKGNISFRGTNSIQSFFVLLIFSNIRLYKIKSFKKLPEAPNTEIFLTTCQIQHSKFLTSFLISIFIRPIALT